MKKRILVVDDEFSIVTLLQYNLEQSGYEVIVANDGEAGMKAVALHQPDLIILDIMLPVMDGIEVCKRLRQNKVITPILMLSAKAEEFDKIIGLELGADDYITKPFSPRELMARVKALLRRVEFLQSNQVAEVDENVIVVAELEVRLDEYLAFFRKQPLELTRKEFELLRYLVERRGKVLSRDVLLKNVWDYSFVGDTRIVDVHISNLRDKIEDDTKNPKYIKTIRGIGYKLEGLV